MPYSWILPKHTLARHTLSYGTYSTQREYHTTWLGGAYEETKFNFHVGGKTYTHQQKHGAKEGCPPPPLLLCVVDKVFHATLREEFPSVHFFNYMDDIAFIAPTVATMKAILEQFLSLSATLGFQGNTEQDPQLDPRRSARKRAMERRLKCSAAPNTSISQPLDLPPLLGAPCAGRIHEPNQV